MIDLVNKIIFIHIPKTGGTSIENFFCNLRGIHLNDVAGLGVFINNKSSNLERQNGHCSLSMYEQIYFDGKIPEDYLIFTVVRDPIKRFWSEYFWRRLPPPRRFPFSFRVPLFMLLYWQKNPWRVLKDLNSHLRPQYKYLEGRETSRVRILRFENLEQDFIHLMKEAGIECTQLPNDNVTKKKIYPRDSIVKKYNGLVKTIYQKDFEYFGY